MKKFLFLVAVATSLFLYSCSEKELSQPVVSASASSSASSLEAQQSLAAARTTPAPGNYKVSLYVNDGDTSTTDFIGYVFTFKANGTLIAKVGKATYIGKWESKDGGTELRLDIDGTPALHEIDKSWDVIKITNALINLTEPEHTGSTEDDLIFTKI